MLTKQLREMERQSEVVNVKKKVMTRREFIKTILANPFLLFTKK